ncbi:hypothetical protein [Streptomyces sp. GbtcB6]|uniref:hypothetical protein n=1 Tax=Streptomyces sp. GbtcB6 TaxID=2824751 RepID=UPI001C311A88|nr:hypothetical protein [Streptomyces sp. GbtcB6]
MADNSEPPKQITPIISAVMYICALVAGVTLVVTGSATPTEATGFIAPFLVIFEGVKGHFS